MCLCVLGLDDRRNERGILGNKKERERNAERGKKPKANLNGSGKKILQKLRSVSGS